MVRDMGAYGMGDPEGREGIYIHQGWSITLVGFDK
jgi:hypothetical protein